MSPGMTLLDGWANADFSGIGETVEDEYGGTVRLQKRNGISAFRQGYSWREPVRGHLGQYWLAGLESPFRHFLTKFIISALVSIIPAHNNIQCLSRQAHAMFQRSQLRR